MSITKKRGSIALARSLCYQINGAADDIDDMDGGGYGSVDIAEILSAEVVRLQEALAQPVQPERQPLTDEEIEHLLETRVGTPSLRYPIGKSDWMQFARAIEAALKEKNFD